MNSFLSLVYNNLILSFCRVEQNNINGQLPTELSLLFDIRYLIIEGARSLTQYEDNDELLFLNGELPRQVFQTLNQLKFLDLNFNKLTGEIPPGVYEALALEELDLDFNVSFTFSLVEDTMTLSNTTNSIIATIWSN